ncbi:HAD family hydrolase [Roseibium sp. M-1]
MPGVPQAIIFDFDGVVANSEVIALKELQGCLQDLGLYVAQGEMIGRFLGSSFEDIAKYVEREVGPVDVEEFRNSWYKRLFSRYEDELKIMPEAEDLFAHLQDRGIPFCIASGGSYRRLNFALSLIGLSEVFNGRAFSADSVSKGKPEPDVFLFAAEKMGVEARDCLVVEDAIAGVQAAKKAEMDAVGYVGGSHLNDCREEHASRLEAAGATTTITRLMDVLELVVARP